MNTPAKRQTYQESLSTLELSDNKVGHEFFEACITISCPWTHIDYLFRAGGSSCGHPMRSARLSEQLINTTSYGASCR